MGLCRAQLRLLAEGLGASLSVVYMTEELEGGNESKLLPLVVYPDTGAARTETIAQLAVGSSDARSDRPRQHTPQSVPAQPQSRNKFAISQGERYANEHISNSIRKHAQQIDSKSSRQETAIAAPTNDDSAERTLHERPLEEPANQRHQVLLPLVSEGTILGLLATTRETQPWSHTEQIEIQQIAQTIALAGILDRRQNWLANELRHQQQIQSQQRDLLHNLLHQLRNPLTAIRTFGKLLVKRLQPEDPNANAANSIVIESDRLQELLKHLESAIDTTLVGVAAELGEGVKPLPASPTEAAAPSANLLLPDADLRIESCQLTDVLDPLIASAEAIATDRHLNFYAHVPRDLPLIQAHPAALREVLSNLIDNALKYTPAGGEVDVDVELTGVSVARFSRQEATPTSQSYLQICVRDTGVGIPPEDLEKLFTRHYRGIQAQGEIAGTGLGLAIAKELVAHMHGKIEVVSPPPGSDRGTEFMLWLPLADRG